MREAQVLNQGEGEVISLPSASLVVKSSDADVAGGKIVGELSVEPGFRGPGFHTHPDQSELFYVLDGEFVFNVNGKDVHVRPGMTITIPPGTTHNFGCTWDGPARLLLIGVPEELDLY